MNQFRACSIQRHQRSSWSAKQSIEMPEVDTGACHQLVITQSARDSQAAQLACRGASAVAEMSMECGEPLHREPQKVGRRFLLETLDDTFYSRQRSFALAPCSIVGCFLQLNLDRVMTQTRVAADERTRLGIELCRFCSVAKL